MSQTLQLTECTVHVDIYESVVWDCRLCGARPAHRFTRIDHALGGCAWPQYMTAGDRYLCFSCALSNRQHVNPDTGRVLDLALRVLP